METHGIINNSLRNWIPRKLMRIEDDLQCRWIYVGDKAYTEPFFDETIAKCLGFPQNSWYKCVTSTQLLSDWSSGIDHVPPTAFIFHVSRCGSTLVSQSLGMLPGTVSLSEVPIFDELLRLPLKNAATEDISNELFAGALKLYAAKRTGAEQNLFIKTDSWHLLFYERIRALFPHTPFIILYRAPGEVLESNRRKRGLQSIADMVEPALYGFEEKDDSFYHPDNYMAAVLEKFFNCIISIATNDAHTLLLNYNEGLGAMMQKIATFTGMRISPAEESQIAGRSNFHAKYPGEKFVEKNVAPADVLQLDSLTELYNQIERLRMKHS
jgi:hypothetical protein